MNSCDEKIQRLEQYKMVLDYNSIVSKTDVHGVITYVNDMFCKVSGYSREELIGKNHNIVKHSDNSPKMYEKMWKTITNKKVWQSTLKNRKKNGETYYVKSTIAPILDAHEKIIEYIAARTDVTELVHKDKIIQNQFLDDLTGLQNRVALLHDLKVNAQQYASLILINIERFSNINDYFGYIAGDEVLRNFANKLKANSEKVYRISGDEFAILCEYELNDDARIEIKGIIEGLEKSPYVVEDLNISLFLSCGVSYAKKEEIYKLSHMALKESKRSSRKITFFNENPQLHKRIKENIELISTIKHAIDNNLFLPFYQGIVDNKTQKIVKYEALMRLQTKDGRTLSPAVFLEHAKIAKLYTQLTMIMIEKVFQQLADSSYIFSINFTLEDIVCEDVITCLFEYLEKYACGERVIIEIVESEGIENFDEVSNFIKKIKQEGCKIAIDDFGSGYSNFSYLGKLDIDFIKIDGSLVEGIEEESSKLVTIESILHYAKKMNIQTIAEFVEDEKTYNLLHNIGVDFSQGYYFSKPQKELL